jgi:hypothetical protein
LPRASSFFLLAASRKTLNDSGINIPLLTYAAPPIRLMVRRGASDVELALINLYLRKKGRGVLPEDR